MVFSDRTMRIFAVSPPERAINMMRNECQALRRIGRRTETIKESRKNNRSSLPFRYQSSISETISNEYWR